MNRADAPGIACPSCGNTRSRVLESRPTHDHKARRRRCECLNGHRFTTYELIVPEGFRWENRSERPPSADGLMRRTIRAEDV